MSELLQLSLEQQFTLRSFAADVKHMDEAKVKELLLHLYAHMFLRENTYKHLLKEKWGLEPSSLPNFPQNQ